ncbi:DUF4126 domain-containing protein [Spirillospora sp. NPDC029432]|uniref:DUF4126 domain-containing protein n=1 Tax=Spirillospora sp. NPDC029432 TaxID=3154599 RepID=UPI003453F75A
MLAALTGLGLSAAAGLNAYIPLLVVGLLDRHTDLVRLPAEFGWLADGRTLALLAVLLAAEIVLDKIPAVDTVNDAIQTAIRPASGGAAFAATEAAARLEEQTPWLGWIAGIAVALLFHLAKASVRPVVNAGTLGTGAPVASTVEDAISLGMSLLAVLAPLVALAGLAVLAYAAYRLLRLRRRLRRRRAAPT